VSFLSFIGFIFEHSTILIFREALPDLVVYPENVEQISKILKICNSNKIPVIPFGAGSGFEGGINAVQVLF
jgi:FAD/FMN-containing dehydrogenase